MRIIHELNLEFSAISQFELKNEDLYRSNKFGLELLLKMSLKAKRKATRLRAARGSAIPSEPVFAKSPISNS